uniref:Uncharacterized protein n=1 Tax=Arundo donax TaxID=35708 RepID=A0A0A8ZX41_ARUDO
MTAEHRCRGTGATATNTGNSGDAFRQYISSFFFVTIQHEQK